LYLNVDEIESAIQSLAAAHPGAAEVVVPPNLTHEGRTTRVLRIGTSVADAVDGVLVLGGVHAREWIPPDALIALAADLLEANEFGTGLAYGSKLFTADQVSHLLTTKNLFLFPCVNADGRHHSQTVDGNWRKNRRPAPAGHTGAACVGVDLNRNFPIVWDHTSKFAADSGVSASADPCNYQVYRGPAAASEPETRNVIWVLDTFPRIRWHIDVHSAVPVILHSWGTDENQSSEPGDTFLNPALDAVRGRLGDGIGEYIDAADLAVATELSAAMDAAIISVSGSGYGYEQACNLYPTSGTSDDYAFSRAFADHGLTKTYAFAMECATTFQPAYAVAENVMREVGAALVAFGLGAGPITDGVDVRLVTTSIEFNDVPEGQSTGRAIVWDVESRIPLTFTVESGPTGPFAVPLGNTISTGPLAASTPVKLWLTHEAGPAGSTASSSITVRCSEIGEAWTIPITAASITSPTVGVSLVLDRSGSMGWDGGDGRARVEILREAAGVFVDVVQPPNGVGVASFDHDARLDTPTVQAGSEIFGTGRALARSAVMNHHENPAGGTSIADGVMVASADLASSRGFDRTAIVVLTDGQETAPAYLSDATGIDDTVFAIGLGRPEDIDPAALTTLTDGSGGYVVATGAIGVDERFVLVKYFLQVLAGVTNEEIVLDPQGHLRPGQEVAVPFQLTAGDRSCDVVLVSPIPHLIEFDLVAPDGSVVAAGPSVPGATFVRGSAVAYHRFQLPLVMGSGGVGPGRWQAQLRVDAAAWKSYVADLEPDQDEMLLAQLRHGVPWMLEVHARSNVRLDAHVAQTGTRPGERLLIRAAVSESDIPRRDVDVVAQVTGPGGDTSTIALHPATAGFEASLVMATSGLYRVRILARGRTIRGERFTREATRSAAAYRRRSPIDETKLIEIGSDAADACCAVSERLGRALSADPPLRTSLDVELRRWGTDLSTLVKCLVNRC
jgi:murein tripeptide amidase MpaA